MRANLGRFIPPPSLEADAGREAVPQQPVRLPLRSVYAFKTIQTRGRPCALPKPQTDGFALEQSRFLRRSNGSDPLPAPRRWAAGDYCVSASRSELPLAEALGDGAASAAFLARHSRPVSSFFPTLRPARTGLRNRSRRDVRLRQLCGGDARQSRARWLAQSAGSAPGPSAPAAGSLDTTRATRQDGRRSAAGSCPRPERPSRLQTRPALPWSERGDQGNPRRSRESAGRGMGRISLSAAAGFRRTRGSRIARRARSRGCP